MHRRRVKRINNITIIELMRMKNRLCKMGQTLLGAACLLTTCGLTYSCSDDYDLPDTTPDFLGASIYDELKNRGNFTTMVRLIDDLGQRDVLSKTGSKTLFVADDQAFAAFFANPIWTTGTGEPVKSYEQLSSAQKRLLFNGCMLDNAYLLEMMPNLGGTGGITKNTCLRQVTSAANTDSISLMNSLDLPRSYNTTERDYWARYNNLPGFKMWLATDNTTPMMTHFMLAQMNMTGITTDDVSFILGLPDSLKWNEGARRNYIYNAQVLSGRDEQDRYQSDVTCLNGYFNVLDRVMLTPSNMAEEIRKNPETSYFSHMLDRFSAPYPDMSLTTAFRALNANVGEGDTVFVKRYISMSSQGSELRTDPDGNTVNDADGVLSYDPGWNLYRAENSSAETDMAAMFVPNNEAMYHFFHEGQGRPFIERYSSMDLLETGNPEDFLRAIDQIPKNRVQPLVNNLMKASFTASVPSKFRTIMNDARDPMFSAFTPETYRELIDTCMLANNGVVYVMNQVVAPATYASVAGPALLSDQSQIINAVITADDNNITSSSYQGAPLKQYFSTYLKAMQSHFSFFIPSDESLGTYGYVDPAAYPVSTSRRYWRFFYDDVTSDAVIPIRAVAYTFDATTGQTENDAAIARAESAANDDLSSKNAQAANGTGGFGATKRNLLIEMVNQHIVVHSGSQAEDGINGDANYYLSRSGSPIHVISKGEYPVVEGGLQRMLNSSSDYTGEKLQCNVIETFDQTGRGEDGSDGYGNGMTYILDRPIQSTMQNTYSAISANSNYSDFLQEAFNIYDADMLRMAGIVDSVDEDDQENELNKYRIFEQNELSEQVVAFFNNFRYTVYLPTNAAMAQAREEGLPTYAQISDFVTNNCDPAIVTDSLTLVTNKTKAKAMITCLVNFLKYHFMDESVFFDSGSNLEAANYETSCINSDANIYLKINVSQNASEGMVITDNRGVKHGVNPSMANLFTRDNKDIQGPAPSTVNRYPKYVGSTSYAVLHELADTGNENDKGFLYFLEASDCVGKTKPFVTWNNGDEAARFVKKYRIRK